MQLVFEPGLVRFWQIHQHVANLVHLAALDEATSPACIDEAATAQSGRIVRRLGTRLAPQPTGKLVGLCAAPTQTGDLLNLRFQHRLDAQPAHFSDQVTLHLLQARQHFW